MIIYNTTWLANMRVHGQADMARHTGAITAEEGQVIKQQHPVGFYNPGLFVRAGLFLLTCIITVFSAALLGLLLIEAHLLADAALPLIYGIITYIVLEFMTKHNNYYKAGVDDALLWLSGAFFVGAYLWYAEKSISHYYELTGSVYIGVLSLVFTLRFSNALMSAVCALAWLSAVFFGWLQSGLFGATALSFVMMLAAGLLYLGCSRLQRHPKARYYDACFTVAQTISLLALYAAGNYYLIDELQGQLTGYHKNRSVGSGFFFWVWTVCVPFIYIAWGIAKKKALPLRTGVLLIAAAAATLRNYYHVLPPEWALTLAGAALLAVVYAVIRYLKTSKHGFTYTAHYNRSTAEQLNAEALISASVTGHVANAPVDTPSRFGGGSFGGGGSGGEF